MVGILQVAKIKWRNGSLDEAEILDGPDGYSLRRDSSVDDA